MCLRWSIWCLPSRSNQRQQQDLQNHFAKRKDRRDEINTVESMLFWLCARFDYTLRDIDQLITRWRLIVRSIPSNHYLDTVVLLSMLVLRQADNNLYQRFVQDPMCTNEVIEYLLGGDAKTTPFPRYFGRLYMWLAYQVGIR